MKSLLSSSSFPPCMLCLSKRLLTLFQVILLVFSFHGEMLRYFNKGFKQVLALMVVKVYSRKQHLDWKLALSRGIFPTSEGGEGSSSRWLYSFLFTGKALSSLSMEDVIRESKFSCCENTCKLVAKWSCAGVICPGLTHISALIFTTCVNISKFFKCNWTSISSVVGWSQF